MNQENTDKIYSAFPQLYRGLYEDESEKNFMSRGFQCRDGWFDIIYELSSLLHERFSNQGIKTSEVKQKWGSLTYRVNLHSEEIEKLISEAKERAKSTCEYCGKDNAELYVCVRWRVVLCKACAMKGKECLPIDEFIESANLRKKRLI